MEKRVELCKTLCPLELDYDETKLAIQEKQSETRMREEIGDQDALGNRRSGCARK